MTGGKAWTLVVLHMGGYWCIEHALPLEFCLKARLYARSELTVMPSSRRGKLAPYGLYRYSSEECRPAYVSSFMLSIVNLLFESPMIISQSVFT